MTKLRTTPLPQTQLGIYIDSVRHEGPQIYHTPFLIKIPGAPSAEALAEAQRKVIAAQPGYSARIITSEQGEPLLVDYSRTEPVTVTVEKISEAELLSRRNSLMRDFELEGGALAHFRVYDTENGPWLFTDVHHVIFDGSAQKYSMLLLDKAIKGEPLEPEQVTPFDIAAEEEADRKSEKMAEAREKMGKLLEGAETQIELLPDSKGGTGYDKIAIPLGISATDFIGWCKGANIPQSVGATAVAGALVSSFSRKDNLTFATIYHGRRNPRYLKTMTMMVKTLPVKVSLSRDTTVSQLLKQTADNLLTARENDLYSFAEAARDYGVNSQFLFAYQGSFLTIPDVGGKPVERIALEKPATGSNLSAELWIKEEELQLEVEFDASLYSRRFAETFARTYGRLLGGFIQADPQEPVSALPLLSGQELEHVLTLGNGGESPADPASTLPQLIHEAALAHPDNIAVVYKDISYTYEQLDQLTDRLAAFLVKLYGVREGDRIGCLIERSPLMAIYPLAVMKTGAAYMPLDPHFPTERLEFMIEDAGVKLILEDPGLTLKCIPSFNGTILPESVLSNLDPSEYFNRARPESPMVVLYTSGSTGKPKGVTLEQHNVVNYCVAYTRMISMGPDDRTGAYAAFGFDAHMMDLYPTLISGAAVHIFDPEMRLDLTAMHDYMEARQITCIFLTTQIGWQMATLFDYTSLRQMSTGGEKLPPIDPPAFDLYNLYGPTECSIASTALKVTEPTDGSIIGRVMAGQQIRILDTSLRPVPQGVAGELVILGCGVGEGYLNRPELTAEKFIEIDGQRAYRTGDQARFTASGEIEYLGRMDGLVKLRGLRIELGEIENVASRHPAIKSFVAAVKEFGGMQNLAGYYTVKEGQTVTPDELQTFMAQDLTEFMIPAVIMQLEQIPLTPNGKVDRRALPVPEMTIEDIVAPETEMERNIFAIVSGILKKEDFGVTSNLLSAGLTSLMAMRLVAALVKELGVRLKAKEVMSAPTVREIAAAAEKVSGQAPAKAESARPKRRYYPLTENQRGVYIDWEMNRDALQYNIPQAFKFASGTDPERLRQAVLKVIEAHPNLLTRMALRNGDVMQERFTELPEIKITELPQAPDAEFFQACVKPFDLLGESLFRCEIFLHAGDVYMMRDTHHIIYDGVSAMVFLEDLQSAYGRQPLEAETYTALDHALDEKDLLESEEAEKAEKWFDSLIGDTEPTSYPKSDRPDSAEPGKMGRIKVRIASEGIKAFCREGALTPSNFLLSAFLQLLHRITREQNVQITTVNNGRADERLLHDTGMFVKTLPVVSRVKVPTASPLEFAKEVQKQFLTSQDFDFYPFTALVEKKGVRPDIMYVFEGGVDMGGRPDSPLPTELISLALDTAKVPLTLLVFEPAADEYEFVAEYDTSIFNEADMRLMLEMTGAIATSLPQARTIADATTITPALEKQLQGIRNGQKLDIPYKSFIGAMMAQADLHPEAPALVACDKRMTYREFDRETSRIANALIKRGVKRGDRVVILLPRRSSLITAIYGVMKTGSAYIPCDPDYPADRIRLITEDSEAKYIITTADRVDLYPGQALDINELLEETDDRRPDVKIEPGDVAYMIYTSGSTGRPKGVMIHQEAITNYIYGYWHQYYREHPEVKTQMLIVTISFDASLNNLAISLTSGHCLVLANEEECKDVSLLAALMEREKVDAFDITPSRLEAMLELPDFQAAVAKASHINIGGEGFGMSLVEKIFATGFSGRAVNEYGPTETTVGSNNTILVPGGDFSAGPPFVNDWNRIVDAWGGELPVGAIGELYIFGRGVGLGYNNLPDKTAAAYVDFHGERAYRTGDLAKWSPEGNVVILGRIDHQVKLRGLRIELGEIENVAKEFGGIKAVAAVREVNKIQHLCLYYTVGSPVDKVALKEHLASRLTEYMVPDSYNEIEDMPLTPNGKTNRKALPEPELVALTEYVEPEGELEKLIADSFAKILHLEKVGANDDFFSIGGTSISAIKVVAALVAAGKNLSYKQVFGARTPRALAALLEGTTAPETEAEAAPQAQRKASEYADVLDTNTLGLFLSGQRQELGDVLLTGATGFMGIHMLHEILTRYTGNVYCLVRGKGAISPESRLRTLLFYYFDSTFDEEFNSGRIRIVEGDVTGPVDPARIPGHVDTVVNCAANVKHFSAGNDIELVNVESVRHLIDYCIGQGARIIHVSTTSIAGESVNGVPAPDVLLSERDFDLGQSLANQYVHSKYEAERLILTAIRERGLNGKIMRVGNLSARASDGEFQVNFRTNAFMGRLKAYVALGCVPYEVLDAHCEFSPIDEVVRAILLLGSTPEGMNVFHPTNNHIIPLGDVIHILSESGLPVQPVEEDEFARRQQEALEDPQKVIALQPLLAYNSDANVKTAFIGYQAHFTNQILYRLGFRWNYTSREYVAQFIRAIEALDFFES